MLKLILQILVTLWIKVIERGFFMFYIILFLSFITIIYSYNKLIKQDKDKKTFAVISIMLTTAMLYAFFINDLKDYSLYKIIVSIVEFTMPWYVDFMKH